MNSSLKLHGIATVNLWAADIPAAQQWYSQIFGIEPYFVRPPAPEPPAYIEYRVGDYSQELGIVDSKYALPGTAGSPAGAVVYWHVDDVPAAVQRLVSMGATEREAPADRGEGFITATVVDPFGNILGVMFNPHYLEVRAGQAL
ncbi:VOC family protein [Salinibacterium sp. ZJ450]|uniref:VOC family protein n=1 Tax=Salinibacterium sp. ZJ450 TaxID=2708338 RepID=UPI00142029F6|nr:VOC family protein [Salinibacterium sp. ZJ450]